MAKREMSEQAKAAKMIRAHLKAHGIAASVTSTSASMMTAVRIELTDELPGLQDEVETYCKQFMYGHFCGSDDSYHYSNTREDLPQATFVTVSTTYTDERKRAVWDWVKSTHNPEHPEQLKADTFDEMTIDDSCLLRQVMTDRRGDFGWVSEQNPRVRAD